jgi:hypothetical protein
MELAATSFVMLTRSISLNERVDATNPSFRSLLQNDNGNNIINYRNRFYG